MKGEAEHVVFVKCRDLEGLKVGNWGFWNWVIGDDEDEGNLVRRAIGVERIENEAREDTLKCRVLYVV